jgi:hypothetical protein
MKNIENPMKEIEESPLFKQDPCKSLRNWSTLAPAYTNVLAAFSLSYTPNCESHSISPVELLFFQQCRHLEAPERLLVGMEETHTCA